MPVEKVISAAPRTERYSIVGTTLSMPVGQPRSANSMEIRVQKETVVGGEVIATETQGVPVPSGGPIVALMIDITTRMEALVVGEETWLNAYDLATTAALYAYVQTNFPAIIPPDAA